MMTEASWHNKFVCWKAVQTTIKNSHNNNKKCCALFCADLQGPGASVQVLIVHQNNEIIYIVKSECTNVQVAVYLTAICKFFLIHFLSFSFKMVWNHSSYWL